MEVVNSHNVLYLIGEDKKLVPAYISSFLFMYSNDPYCFIYTEKERFQVRKTFIELEWQCIADKLLLKVHRSFIIRFDCDRCIKAIHRTKSGGRIEPADYLKNLLLKYNEDIKLIPVSPEGMEKLYSFEPPILPRQLTLF